MDYQLSMYFARSMAQKGLITRRQYGKIEKALREKYHPVTDGLFTRNLPAADPETLDNL